MSSIILAFRNHPHFLRVSTSASLPWPLLSSPCLGSWRWQRSNQFQFFSPTCEFEATSGPLRLIGGQDFWKWLVTSGRICAVSHDNLQCLEPPNTHLNSNSNRTRSIQSNTHCQLKENRFYSLWIRGAESSFFKNGECKCVSEACSYGYGNYHIHNGPQHTTPLSEQKACQRILKVRWRNGKMNVKQQKLHGSLENVNVNQDCTGKNSTSG